MPTSTVFNEIKAILEGNGNITQKTKDKLLLTGMVCLHAELCNMHKKIDERSIRSRDRLERIIDGAFGALVSLLIAYIFVKVTGFIP